jgi:hypothetical protein
MQTNDSDDLTPEVTDAHAPEATHTEPLTGEAPTDSPEESSDEQATSPLDRKLRSENQSLRKRLRDLEAAQKAREEAELSEQERAQRRMIELEEQVKTTTQRARDAALRAEINAAATKFGIVDVDAASRLLDTNALEYDDTDGWVGVDDALRTLTQDRPWLVQTNTHTPGATANPTNPPRRRSTLTKEALSKMSKAEVDALPWDDVLAALAE